MRNEVISSEREIEPEAASVFGKNSFLASELTRNACFLVLILQAPAFGGFFLPHIFLSCYDQFGPIHSIKGNLTY